MIPVSSLPAVNALLNATSAILLVAGLLNIRKKRITRHRNFMIAAVCCSALFLTSYLIYHYNAGSKPFQGQGLIRPIYFTILISHTILATAIVPLVLLTLYRAVTEKFVQHARIARWTLPIWLYVSVTGVVIYFMLYQM